MSGWIIVLTKQQALQVLEALDVAVALAFAVDNFGSQILFEDAFQIIRDALLPNLPSG